MVITEHHLLLITYKASAAVLGQETMAEAVRLVAQVVAQVLTLSVGLAKVEQGLQDKVLLEQITLMARQAEVVLQALA
jgi:hypothetical protein